MCAAVLFLLVFVVLPSISRGLCRFSAGSGFRRSSPRAPSLQVVLFVGVYHFQCRVRRSVEFRKNGAKRIWVLFVSYSILTFQVLRVARVHPAMGTLHLAPQTAILSDYWPLHSLPPRRPLVLVVTQLVQTVALLIEGRGTPIASIFHHFKISQ